MGFDRERFDAVAGAPSEGDSLIGEFLVHVDRDEPIPDRLIQALADSFREYKAGVPIHEALRLKKKAGRKNDPFRRRKVAHAVAALERGAQDHASAVRAVAKATGKSESLVERYFREFGHSAELAIEHGENMERFSALWSALAEEQRAKYGKLPGAVFFRAARYFEKRAFTATAAMEKAISDYVDSD